MINNQLVQDDLLDKLNEVATVPVTTTNEIKQVQAGQTHIRATFEFARARMTDANLTEFEQKGRMKIDVMSRPGSGSTEGNELAMAIAEAAFKPGVYNHYDYQIVIESVYIETSSYFGAIFVTPLRVDFTVLK